MHGYDGAKLLTDWSVATHDFEDHLVARGARDYDAYDPNGDQNIFIVRRKELLCNSACFYPYITFGYYRGNNTYCLIAPPSSWD